MLVLAMVVEEGMGMPLTGMEDAMATGTGEAMGMDGMVTDDIITDVVGNSNLSQNLRTELLSPFFLKSKQFERIRGSNYNSGYEGL